MRIERRYVQSGVFLIAIGGVPLAVQLGWLDRPAVANAGRLWPILLIVMPAAAMGGSITVNAGHLGLCLPAGAGLRIEASGTLPSNNFADQGLTEIGDTWTSPGLALNALVVDLQVTANAGNIELNPEGGCQ